MSSDGDWQVRAAVVHGARHGKLAPEKRVELVRELRLAVPSLFLGLLGLQMKTSRAELDRVS